jgi:hypothetical protein
MVWASWHFLETSKNVLDRISQYNDAIHNSFRQVLLKQMVQKKITILKAKIVFCFIEQNSVKIYIAVK